MNQANSIKLIKKLQVYKIYLCSLLNQPPLDDWPVMFVFCKMRVIQVEFRIFVVLYNLVVLSWLVNNFGTVRTSSWCHFTGHWWWQDILVVVVMVRFLVPFSSIPKVWLGVRSTHVWVDLKYDTTSWYHVYISKYKADIADLKTILGLFGSVAWISDFCRLGHDHCRPWWGGFALFGKAVPSAFVYKILLSLGQVRRGGPSLAVVDLHHRVHGLGRVDRVLCLTAVGGGLLQEELRQPRP